MVCLSPVRVDSDENVPLDSKSKHEGDGVGSSLDDETIDFSFTRWTGPDESNCFRKDTPEKQKIEHE